ncbi:alpha/beta fold hydrolase [Arthrobacter antioxidans]|uniref:alpha/beta fold hydrolase n=1 Tax=Arthrobacter antioxidans TaxID=2895818 RepID=UPI001FFE69EA|nr:alpha/beta hydrolase [Arthrobacter antioxidans]
MQPTLRTVRVDGLSLRIRTTPGPGSPASPRSPYVLVHGLGMTHRYLDRLRAELAADAVVHTVDLPGYGPGPRPRIQLGVEDHAALMVEALGELGVRSGTLVGHSMGVQFVTEAALQSPALAERLVLIGPVVDRLRRTVLQQAVALAHDTLRESASANRIVLGDYLQTGTRWYLRQLRSMMEYPLERAVERLRCPVLVVRGGRDPVARREWCRELATRAPDGTLVEIEGQPHVVQHSAAARVAAEIVAFSRRTALPS